tara:strand:- start:1631 stop:2407 length:777 start_codon:yes stop_codon:yes gene_type:complete
VSLDLKAIADELLTARLDCQPVAPITARYHGLSVEDAYAIQTLISEQRLLRGERIVGYKVGLTSVAVQQQLGVSEPDFGLVFASMEVRKDQPLDSSRLIAAKAEGEIGFVFNRDIEHTDITLTELKSAIDYFFPVVEVVDSAIADWKITLIDTVADNASSGLYIPGDSRYSPDGVDFAELEIVIRGEGVNVAGRGAACLGNPLYATQWLVRKMVSLGRPIRRGQLVLSGALAPMVPVVAGQTLQFDFKGLESIAVTAI